jgi:ribonucleoside-diphosphate reductase alpha chain
MTATKNNLLAAFKDNGDSNRGFALSTSLKPVREVFDELHGDARQKMRVRIKDGSVNIYYLARACRIANRHIWLADLIDNGAFFDSVQSVESSESFTLDITVPQTNTYIANGFVSHNTVGLLLGCDTLAIEPDFSIVKFKRLSGGGTMKIVNESLRKALENLGYTINQVNDILTYVLGHNTLVGAPHINRESLADAGIDKEDIEKIEKDIAGHVELRNAVSAYSLSDDSKQAIGLDKSDKNIFKRLGFSREQYAAANLWICGHGTLEGAPHIKAEHLPVFDCANRSGVGQRFIKPEAHVMAMAAVTPFISGAISKTVNMPNSATEADIDGIYKLSFKHGVKCMALYRDGCKRSQPLNNPGDISWWDESDYMPDSVYMRGQRKRPPKKRGGVTQEFKVFAGAAEHKVWIQTGEYEDGRLCEVWIDVSKENSDFRLAMKWWARAISNAVQYGQPLEEIAHSFVLEEGGPSGRTDHPYIVFCKSIPDLVLKWLSLEYLADTTWCRRRPPISELRCSQSKSALMDVGKRYQAAKKVVHRVDAPVLTVQKTHIDKCPICGSASIIPWPCPTCSSCGASLGGCSP